MSSPRARKRSSFTNRITGNFKRSRFTRSPSSSRERPANSSTQNSLAKARLRTAWHGVEQLLQKVGKCLDGTPFKAPISALNVLIEVTNAVVDNNDALQDRFAQTFERLELVNAALLKADSDVPRVRMQSFAEKLVAEAIKLKEMSARSTFTRILESEEDKTTIKESFQRIDEFTKDFHLGIVMSIERSTDDMGESLFQLHLSSWPRSRKAAYNAEVGGAGTLAREPCTEGTRIDILQRIYRWAVDPSSESPCVFWLTGQAGSGKSTIAYTVADHFDDGEKDDDEMDVDSDLHNVLGANFFCSRQFQETRLQKNILPTIVYQLARRSRSYANALLRANKFDSVDVLTKQMRDLLVDPWQRSASERPSEIPPYLVVVDALDEIEGEGGSAFLRDLLKTIDKGRLRGLKFLVTSRPDPELADLCSSFKSDAVCHLYEVPTDTVNADIATYLRAKLPALHNEGLLDKLAQKADGLFIYAATAVRYIGPRYRMSKTEQLRLLGRLANHVSPMSESADAPPLIDTLYQQILLAAFCNLDNDLFCDRLKILHTLLCTEERVSTSIAGRLSDLADTEMAKMVVDELHAVLYVKDDRILWYHASFPDFMFTQARSKFKFPSGTVIDMSCDEAAQHALLSHSCFQIMKSDLRFNICNLPSSFLLDSEVPDLSRLVAESISDILGYSCRYWAQHLARAASHDDNSLRTCIRDFLRLQVLFWIEAMNLLGSPAQCTPMLQRAREWVLKQSDVFHSDLAVNLAEAANFATYFTGSPAVQSTPHLYISSLVTWRQESTMSQHWNSQFSRAPSFKHTGGGSTVSLMIIQNQSSVSSVAFSSDGNRIVSGSSDNSVRVWDASTGAELMRLNGHTSWVDSVAFSSDGTRIVSGSGDKSVRVWDASTGVELMTLNGHTEPVVSVAFSSDGTRIVSGSHDKSVRGWDASMGAELMTLNGHTDWVQSVAFSSDGNRIVSGSQDNSVRVWDAWTGAEELMRLNGHTSCINSVAFSSDGTHIVSGSHDESVRVWDALIGAELMRLNGHTSAVYSVVFSSDGTRIVSGSQDDSVRVWDAWTGAELMRLDGHTSVVNSVAFSSDGTRIVSGSDDNSVRVWDALMGAELTRLNGHAGYVNSVAVSSDGTRIVSGSEDNSVRVWDALTGAELMRLDGHTSEVNSVAFSSDGTRIVFGSLDGSVRVWDALTGAELMRLNGHAAYVTFVAFSSDGTRIVSGSYDNSVRVWDASMGAELTTLNGHTSCINSVAFLSDGTRIVSGSDDKSVRVWDDWTGAELMRLNHAEPVDSVAFLSDGTRIVSGSRNNSVQVWDASMGAELMRLSGHTDWVKSVAFSSDGNRIVSGSMDNSVRVWDASTGAELMRLNGHAAYVTSVAFSSDGTRIVSGSADRSVRVWDALMGVELARLNGHTFSANSTMLSHIFSAPDYDSVLAWDTVHNCNQWTSTIDNWIVGLPYRERLMWVHPEIQAVLYRPGLLLLISPNGSATIDFAHSKIGMEWAECRTP